MTRFAIHLQGLGLTISPANVLFSKMGQKERCNHDLGTVKRGFAERWEEGSISCYEVELFLFYRENRASQIGLHGHASGTRV